MNMNAGLEKKSQLFWVIVGIVLIAGVGAIDLLTGYEIAFSLFYLIPIALITWFAGKQLGIAASICSALAWSIADVMAGHPYPHPAIYYWNTAIRFGFFIVVALLLAALRKSLKHEQELARTDYLTGAANMHSFFDLLQREIDLSQRYKQPLTLAYIDLDNFKIINDRFGHNAGNKVLCAIVNCAKSQLRKTDIVARLGGDEFAFLLPRTDQEAAQVIISKVHLSLLDEMQKINLPATFSIGVLTSNDEPHTTDELVRMADNLMYSVKNNGKNGINYSVLTKDKDDTNS
jgi:diguanylate cyclase (GGDEF)-like protein